MSALPRPDVTGSIRALNDALHDLHHRAGWPSLRALAKETGVSHTTVSKAFSQPALPTWGTLELLVEAMHGDASQFHDLWLAASTPINGAAPPATRIAGRRAELDVLRRHLESGNGLLLVTGEAGIGKTTLVRTAAESTRTLVAVGHCLALSSDVPLLPIADCLRGLLEGDSTSFARALASCPPYVAGSLASLVPEAVSGTAPSSDDRQLLFAAIGALVRAMAGDRPTALVLEDLHWADPGTLDLVEHLLGRGLTLPVVGTWRSAEDGLPRAVTSWSRRIRRLPGTTVLRLGPLTRAETAHQLRLLGLTAPKRVDRIHQRSQGQPLFTEQLAACREDAGLPELLADLLDQRLVDLDDAGWAVIRTLGVAARRLEASVLGAASGLDESDLVLQMRALTSRHLLRFDDGRVDLQHPLLAEAVRRRLVAGEGIATHRALAVALAGQPSAEPAEVAGHWRAAGSPADELVWRIRAASTAASRFAASQAAEHWVRVLTLWPDGAATAGDPPLSYFEALSGLARDTDRGGRPAEATAWLDAALADPERFETAERAQLLHYLARTNSTQFTHGGRGLALIEESVALFRTVPPSPGLAAALNWQSVELEWHGRREEAMTAITEAADVATATGDRILQRAVRAQRAWQLAASSDPGAVREIEELEEELPGGEDPVRDLAVAIRHTDILLMACRPAAEVEAAARRELEVAERWELLDHRVKILTGNVSQALRRAGRLGTAHGIVSPHTAHGHPGNGPPFLHTERALLDLLRGDTEAARRRAAFFELGRHEFADSFIVEVLMLDDLWAGRPGAAFDRTEDVLRSRHDEMSPGIVGDLMALTARCAADMVATAPASTRRATAGRLESLRAHLHHDPYEPGAVRADRAAEPQWRAELARTAAADDADSWLRAVREWDDLSRPHDAAYCRWRAAQAALRDGQGTVAARLLKRAAVDAREHVPLSRAIATTVATGR